LQAWPGLTGAGLLAFARLVCILGLLGEGFAPTSARAAEASVEASEQDGFGRIVFTFTDTPAAEAVVSSGILVVTFDKAVDASVAVVEQGLTHFVTAARRDPDGMAVRFALSRAVKVNTMAAGEKLFVDIMPATWRGMPPPLPPEIMAELTRRALEAQKAKEELERSRNPPPATMTLNPGSNPDNIRLSFAFTRPVDVQFEHDGPHAVLTVPADTQFDAASARAALPPQITAFSAKISGDTLVVRFSAPDGKHVRGRMEEEDFVVDMAEPKTPAPVAGIPPGTPAAAAPSQSPAAAAPKPVADAPRADMAAKAPEEHPAPVLQPHEAPTAVVTAEPRLASENAAALAGDKAVAVADAVPPKHIVGEAQPAEKSPSAPDLKTILNDAPGKTSAQDMAAADLAKAAEEGQGVDVHATDKLLQIAFPFSELPAAAAFVRGAQLFVVFDGVKDFDVSAIEKAPRSAVSAVRKTVNPEGVTLAIHMAEPRLASLTLAGKSWVLSLGENILEPVRPLDFRTTFLKDGRTALEIGMQDAGGMHEVIDPVVGDTLRVVTTRDASYGVMRGRELIDLSVLPSAQGLVVKPNADDLSFLVEDNTAVITRAKGLTLTINSPAGEGGDTVELRSDSPFAAEAWRKAKMATRETFNDLERVVATSKVGERTKARVQLARFYLANGDAAEAKGVLDVAEKDSTALSDDPDVKLLRGVSLIMLRRFEEASELLTARELADMGEAALWRMVAEAGLGNVALAREAFREGEAVLPAMPVDLQRIFRQAIAKVAVGAQDYAVAAAQMDALDNLDIEEDQAKREVLRGRIAEGFGQNAQALEAYRRALESDDEIAKAEARLYATNLRYAMKEIERPEAVKELEELTAYWRGDLVEANALARLADLHREEGQWREAFTAMQTAAIYHPDAPSTRFVQEEMSSEFARLFLSEGPDAAPPNIESVALFYDFKELTPPGNKGDELIRKLADRLVQVDLLTQAADLLSYQVRNRLNGAARAQVAAHAAAIELMDRKPDRALDLLHETRLAGLPEDLVRSRLILEARALSDMQRPDLALEMIAAYSGEEISRLRADIQWSARRWQPAGEGLEVVLGDAWKGDKPLDLIARQDVLRAGIAYALSEDVLGLDRLRQKFAWKMAGTPEQIAFDTVTAPSSRRSADFGRIAAAASVADTFRNFLESYRKRYPENTPPQVDPAGETKAETGAPART